MTMKEFFSRTKNCIAISVPRFIAKVFRGTVKISIIVLKYMARAKTRVKERIGGLSMGIFILNELDDRMEILKVPVWVFRKHCEVYGAIYPTGMLRREYNLANGYLKVDGERMPDLSQAARNLRRSVLSVVSKADPEA